MNRVILSLSIAIVAMTAPRAHADASHDQILNAYRQGVQKLGLSPDDFTVALATFLAGCHVGYFNVDPPPDDQFRALVTTLQPMSGQIASRLGAERAKTQDFFVIAGTTFVIKHAALAKQPDATQQTALRDQASKYLQGVKIDPQTLQQMFGALGKRASTAPAPSTPTPAPTTPAPTTAAPQHKEFEVERGKGIGTAEVAAVLHSWWTGTSMYEDETYVLFKDGTVRQMPSVAFDSFDAAGERAAKPLRWGTWQRQGNQYALKMGNAAKFSVPSHPEIYRPGRANDTFDGTFEKHTSGFNSYSNSYMRLDANHRFSNTWSGGTQAQGIPGDSGTPTVTTHYDQDGATTSVSGEHIGGGTSRRKPNGASNREGTYTIEGYTIELHYDSGRVERMPFYTAPDRKQVGIGGTAYWLAKKS